MKELYLPSFAEAVRAGTGSIMWYVLLSSGRGAVMLSGVARIIRSTALKLARTALL